MCLFKLMLLCAAPVRGRQHVSWSVIASERQEVLFVGCAVCSQ